MRRPTLLLLVVPLVVSGCIAAPSPSASSPPDGATAGPTAIPAPTAVAPTATTAEPTAGPTAAGPTPPATLTPTAADPGVSMVATWWLDPASLPIDPGATQLRGFVLERECASGHSPEGRILAPDIDYGAEALTITFSIAPLPGDQDCVGNTPFGVVFGLEDPVDGRPILDGGTVPARDATIPGQ
jgi:hypothetical protein